MTWPPENGKAGDADTSTGRESGSPREQTSGEHSMSLPFVVYTERDDGRRRVFQRYPSRREADAVVQMLRNITCRAFVEDES